MIRLKGRKEILVVSIITFLIVLIALTETILPDQIQLSEYEYYKEESILSSPDDFENTKISSAATIVEINVINSSYNLLTTEKGLHLEISSTERITKYDAIAFRGIAFLKSKGTIEVSEIHKFNASVYYYSAPGIILFLVIFFYTFKFDFKTLSLKPRRSKNAWCVYSSDVWSSYSYPLES